MSSNRELAYQKTSAASVTENEEDQQALFDFANHYCLYLGQGKGFRGADELRKIINDIMQLNELTDDHGNPILHLAVLYNRIDIVKIFIRKGYPINIHDKY